MGAPVTIALDGMGGDHGPSVVIPAAAITAIRHPEARFLLVGDSARIEPELRAHLALAAKSQVVHTDIAVAMDEKPSQALRKGRWKSSMWLALEAVRDGRADAAVSAGNTGALMVMAKFCLKTIQGIDRPAIAAIWPTIESECIVLDVGANVGADSRQLVEFALMGAALARALFGMERPSVGLLNIGVEEVKGGEEIRKASEQLRAMNLPELDYIGFVEGDGIGAGAADVIVSEGFSGNIALKAAEGTARQMADFLRNAMASSWQSKIGYLFARSAFKALRDKLDPNKSNGGVLLGLKGVVVKSHGGINAEGFAYAVDVGYEMVRCDLLTKINQMLNRDGSALAQAQTAQEAVS